eukprot:2113782-Prymnesium_polylepis.1
MQRQPSVLARFADGTSLMIGTSLPGPDALQGWPRLLSSLRSYLMGGSALLANHYQMGDAYPCSAQGRKKPCNQLQSCSRRGSAWNASNCHTEYLALATKSLGPMLAAVSRAPAMSTRLVLTLPAHFNTPGGGWTTNMTGVKASNRHGGGWTTNMTGVNASKRYAPGCVPHNSPIEGVHWRNEVLRSLAIQHNSTRLVDILPLLWDAPGEWHVGYRPTYDKLQLLLNNKSGKLRQSTRNDCLHWCHHDRVWSPIVASVMSELEPPLQSKVGPPQWDAAA